jgi:hypothetical protein
MWAGYEMGSSHRVGTLHSSCVRWMGWAWRSRASAQPRHARPRPLAATALWDATATAPPPSHYHLRHATTPPPSRHHTTSIPYHPRPTTHTLASCQVSELDPAHPTLRTIAHALEQHALVRLRAAPTAPTALTPRQLRQLYARIHTARFPYLPCEPPPRAGPANSDHTDGNLRGRCFAGFPETNVLGHASEVVDWHGLSGWLTPTAWWERASGQFHHEYVVAA